MQEGVYTRLYGYLEPRTAPLGSSTPTAHQDEAGTATAQTAAVATTRPEIDKVNVIVEVEVEVVPQVEVEVSIDQSWALAIFFQVR